MVTGRPIMLSEKVVRYLVGLSLLAALTGCTIHPAGESAEREAALRAGKPFTRHVEDQVLPPLPDNPTPDDLVQYALSRNADLEQRYWEWRSAIEQIPQDGTQASTLALSAGTTITRGKASAGGSTIGLLNDPMTDIHWPGTLATAAQRSLENARAAGIRFRKAQFELRNKILSAYADYALSAELIRLEQANADLLQTTAMVVEARNRAGAAGQQDLLKARNELDLSRNDIANMQAQLPAQRAVLNALLSREPDAPLAPPGELPQQRPIVSSDAQLLELAARQDPELTALASEIRGKEDGIRLARLQYVPDFNISLSTDLMGIAQSLAGSATIPLLRYEAIEASIAQAEANLKASEAMRLQARDDLNARVVTDIATLRDADRQVDLFEHTVLPRTRQVVTVGRSAYETGQSTLLDFLDSQRSLIAVQRLIANLRSAREKRLADLEAVTAQCLAGTVR
jgi:cobalt-zinc-cadmium efflux system outer membrane protein